MHNPAPPPPLLYAHWSPHLLPVTSSYKEYTAPPSPRPLKAALKCWQRTSEGSRLGIRHCISGFISIALKGWGVPGPCIPASDCVTSAVVGGGGAGDPASDWVTSAVVVGGGCWGPCIRLRYIRKVLLIDYSVYSFLSTEEKMSKGDSKQVSVVLRDCTLYFSEDEDSEDWQKMLQVDLTKDNGDLLKSRADSSITKPEIMINSEGEEEAYMEDPHIPVEGRIIPRPNTDNEVMKQMNEKSFEILELKKTLLGDHLQSSDVEETYRSLYNPNKKRRKATRNIPGISPPCESSVMGSPETQNKLGTQQVFALDECGYSFMMKGNCPANRETHSVGSPYLCPNCGISFSSNEHLKRFPSVHAMGELYSCPNCGRKLFQKHLLSGDQRDFTAENPYLCTECEESFQNDDDLTKHQAFHLENPYWCAECDIRFTCQHDLKAHCNSHMGERPPQSKEFGNSFRGSNEQLLNRQGHAKKVKKPKKPITKCKKRTYAEEKPY